MMHSGGRLGILREHGELLGVSGSCKTPVSGGGSRRAELSVSYHQPMGELVALAVLPHGFVIFFCVSGVPQEMRLLYNW